MGIQGKLLDINRQSLLRNSKVFCRWSLKPVKSPVGLYRSWMLESSKLEAKYEIKCCFSVIIARQLVFGFSVLFSDFHFRLKRFSQNKVSHVCQYQCLVEDSTCNCWLEQSSFTWAGCWCWYRSLSVVFHKIVPITATLNSRTSYSYRYGAGCWGVDIVHSAMLIWPLVCQQDFFQDFDSGKWHLVISGVPFQISWPSLNRSFIVRTKALLFQQLGTILFALVLLCGTILLNL